MMIGALAAVVGALGTLTADLLPHAIRFFTNLCKTPRWWPAPWPACTRRS